MIKTCCLCSNSKDISEFNKKSCSPDGYQNFCRQCSSETNKKHYKSNKQKVILRSKNRNLKVKTELRVLLLERFEFGCVDCGENDPVVLEFDHLGDKEYSISEMVGAVFSKEKVIKELEKCVVRCANCHKRKTAKDFNWWKISE